VEAVEATAASDNAGGSKAAAEGEGQEEEEEEEGPCAVRQELFGLPGNPALQLQLVLPPDLMESFGELQQLTQVGALLVCWLLSLWGQLLSGVLCSYVGCGASHQQGVLCWFVGC
jgi:hypothetical protein